VVIYSAKLSESDEKLAEQTDAYLVKPFDVKSFVETIKKLVRSDPS